MVTGGGCLIVTDFTQIDGIDDQVRLQHHPEEQSEIIENLEQYLILCE